MPADDRTPNQPPGKERDAKGRDEGSKGDAGERRAEPVSAVEWVAAGTGLLLLLGVVGSLAREAAVGASRPPDVTVAVDTVAQGRGGWLVEFAARNGGDQTAAELVVRGTLTAPDGREHAREARLDYLPARSTRRGGLVFPVDPRTGALRLEAVSFQEP